LLNTIIADARIEDRFLLLGATDIEVESDIDIVHVIASNLLGNAIKYSEPETNITIHSEIIEDARSKRLEFSVQNVIGSMGAPDPVLAFDKYYRSASAAKISGSGLGLFLVRELARALNGEVKLVTKDNLITFTVWIPI
jgi:signal transduction histidine kinase